MCYVRLPRQVVQIANLPKTFSSFLYRNMNVLHSSSWLGDLPRRLNWKQHEKFLPKVANFFCSCCFVRRCSIVDVLIVVLWGRWYRNCLVAHPYTALLASSSLVCLFVSTFIYLFFSCLFTVKVWNSWVNCLLVKWLERLWGRIIIICTHHIKKHCNSNLWNIPCDVMLRWLAQGSTPTNIIF